MKVLTEQSPGWRMCEAEMIVPPRLVNGGLMPFGADCACNTRYLDRTAFVAPEASRLMQSSWVRI